MDTTPLPNQEDDISEDGLTTNYVIRITPCEKFNTDQLLEFIKNEMQISKYVIGRETVPQEHFHLVVQTDITISEQEVRDIIKAFLTPLWATQTGKLPRGFGNKQYNLQICENLDRAVSYSLKLGEFWFEGFEEEYINQRKLDSFEKKKPCDFKKEYTELCTRFQETDMDVREFMTAFVTLKAKYGQQVRMTDAYSYALSNLIKRNPAEADNLVENYLYKQ